MNHLSSNKDVTVTSTMSKKIPEEINTCCSIRGRRCVCMPYDDAYLIAAQVLAIFSTSVAWIWWPTGILNIVGFILFQIPWCCRQTPGALKVSVTVAALTCLCMVGLGLKILFLWSEASDCYVFTGDLYYPGKYGHTDWCNELLWAILAFGCAAIWGAATHCMIVFLASGRHAKWETYYSNNVEESTDDSSPDVESFPTDESPELQQSLSEDSPEIQLSSARAPPPAEITTAELDDNRTIEIHEAILVPDDYSGVDILTPDHIYKDVNV